MLARRAGPLTILAGGTDVYPAKTHARGLGGHAAIADILDISRIAGCAASRSAARTGASARLTTWTDIIAATCLPLFDGLKAAAREIGGVQIQNRGTIAGNICTASPAADWIPCLLALDAEIEVLGRDAAQMQMAARCSSHGILHHGLSQDGAGAGEIVTAHPHSEAARPRRTS